MFRLLITALVAGHMQTVDLPHGVRAYYDSRAACNAALFQSAFSIVPPAGVTVRFECLPLTI